MPRLATELPVSLPAVIRPKPITLAEVEHHLTHHDDFGAMLRDRPLSLAAIANAVHRRDPMARARFGDATAIRLHLEKLL